MKRKIKFRVWDIFKKTFIPSDVYAIVQTDFNAFGIMLKDWMDYREGEYFYDNSQILSQFTGLTDKHGKEIYDGDIVRGVGKHKGQSEVFFDTNCYTYQPMSFLNDYNGGNYEIIGSIYENPELLNP